VLEKAVQPDPYKRYEALSEFMYDLRHPSAEFLRASPAPRLERNPPLFWKGLSFFLASAVLFLLAYPLR
jgi:hypothetical protein